MRWLSRSKRSGKSVAAFNGMGFRPSSAVLASIARPRDTGVMGSTINRVMWGFVAAFFVAVAAAFVYQVVWAWPQERCLRAHHWWDPYQRVCATPIDLRVFTGRPNRAPPAIGPGAKP